MVEVENFVRHRHVALRCKIWLLSNHRHKLFSREGIVSNVGEITMLIAVLVMCQNAESHDGGSHMNA